MLTISSAGSWQSVNLVSYGVADGDLALITFYCTVGGPLYGGARKVGSELDRRNLIHSNCGPPWPVLATGANATVELYTQHTSDCQAYLMGYWS